MAKYLDYDGLGKVWTKITEKFQKKIKNCTVSTGSTGAKWYKVAEGTILKNNTNTDYHIVFDVFDTLDHPSQYAKVRARVRVGSTKGTVTGATLQYLEKTSDDGTFYTDWLRMYWKGNETITEGVKVEFWTYLKVAYSGKKFVVESEFDRYKNTTDGGDITFTTNTTSGTPPNVPETPTNTDWHLVSPTYVQSANTAEKAAKDGDGNTISSTYLKLSGGTVTGDVESKGNIFLQENASAYTCGIVSKTYNAMLGFDTDGKVGLYGKAVCLRGASKKGTSSGKGLVVQENEIITQAMPMCINPGTASSYNEGLRINKANNNYSIINFGGAADSISGVSSTDWTIGRRGADTSASNYYSPAGTFIFAYGGTNSGSGVTLTTAGGIVATHNIHTKEGLYIGRSFTATSSSGGAKMAYNSTTQCIEFTFPD